MRGRSGVGNFFAAGGVVMAVVGVVVLVGGIVGSAPGALIAGGVFLTVGVIWAGVGLGLRALYRGWAASAAREQQLFASGEKAEATIESVETTGMVVNNLNAQTRLRLRVRPRHGAEYTVERRMLIPFTAMPRPGDLITVAYDPATPTRLALDTDWRMDTGGGRALNVRRPDAAPAADVPAPAASSTAPDRVQALTAQLEELQRLRDQGTLTDDEFEAEKAKLLARG
jgi:hypothetical protein